MRLNHIIDAPTTINNVHQSVYRDSHILDYVLWLLENKTPHDVIIGIMSDLDNLPNKEHVYVNGQVVVTELEDKP